MEIIEFQVDNVIKNLYNQLCTKTERFYCIWKEISDVEIIYSDHVYGVLLHYTSKSASSLFRKRIISRSNSDPKHNHKQTPWSDKEDSMH